MREREWMRRLGRETRAGLRMAPWLLVSLLLALVLWQADSSALAGLFQSPPGSTPTVPATSTPADTPTLVPTETLTPVITDTPTVLPSDTPTVLPSDTPTATPEETPTPTATLEPPAEAESPSPTAEAQGGAGRYAEGESDLSFDWGMLFDAVALGLSYAWLCCGVLIVLGVPLFFLALWVASKRRRRSEE